MAAYRYRSTPQPRLEGPTTCPLDRAWVSLGTDPACDLVLEEGEACHARVELTPKGAYLVDLETPTGTWLNGRRISRALLRDGDQLCFVPPTARRGSELGVQLSQEMLPEGEVTRAGHLQVLLEVATELSRPEQLELRLDQILRLLLELLPFDRAALRILKQPYQGEPVFDRQAWRTRYGQDSEEESPQLSGTVIGKVLATQQGVRIQDALYDSEFGKASSVKSHQIRTCLCFPLKTSNSLLGVLYADAQSQLKGFNDEDLTFFSAFASHAAVAVENALLSERIQQEAVARSRLQRFLPPSTVEEMLARPEAASLGGSERDVTILFCDIRNFTELSCCMPPGEVAALLNGYFPDMVRIVFSHGGTLEKYIGDALMAVWGAPLAMEGPAQVEKALAAARAMRRTVLQSRLPFEVGIGINTGRAFVGNIGDESFMQYAAIGAATNLAARLCSQAGPGEIVLSQSSQALLGCSGEASEELVKGFAEPVRVFRI
ncbi:GAF domain-containing protein [bacterium CPR1]|nr:GAF domain-containing protein [bacterium CPR1]